MTLRSNRWKTNWNKLVHQLQCLYWNIKHQALIIQHHTQFRYKQCLGALQVAGFRINSSKRQCSTKVLIFIWRSSFLYDAPNFFTELCPQFNIMNQYQIYNCDIRVLLHLNKTHFWNKHRAATTKIWIKHPNCSSLWNNLAPQVLNIIMLCCRATERTREQTVSNGQGWDIQHYGSFI